MLKNNILLKVKNAFALILHINKNRSKGSLISKNIIKKKRKKCVDCIG